MKKTNIFLFLTIFLILLAAVEAATVSHPASNVTAGRFGGDYYSIGRSATSGYGLMSAGSTGGVLGYGYSYGGAFQDSDATSQIYLAYGDYGIYQDKGNKNYFSGSVGIGTTGPDRKLDILDASNPQLRLTYTDGTVYTDLQTISSGNLYINPSGGKVGIGTTSPATKLVVDESSNANSVISIDSGSTSSQISAIDFYDKGTNEWGIGKDSGNNFYIDESGVANRLTIKPGGNVGIGDTSPDTGTQASPSGQALKLDIEGAVGAKYYCDENGNNCKTIVQLGSGTDTRCDTSGTCTQVCVGNDCRTAWPSYKTLAKTVYFSDNGMGKASASTCDGNPEAAGCEICGGTSWCYKTIAFGYTFTNTPAVVCSAGPQLRTLTEAGSDNWGPIICNVIKVSNDKVTVLIDGQAHNFLTNKLYYVYMIAAEGATSELTTPTYSCTSNSQCNAGNSDRTEYRYGCTPDPGSYYCLAGVCTKVVVYLADGCFA